MKLNDIGKMVNKWLTKIPEHFIGSSLDIYQIMPNHVHVIIVIKHSNNGSTHGSNGSTHGSNGSTHGSNGSTHGSTPTIYTLGNMMQWFKTMTTNEYISGVKNKNWPPFDKKIWQRNFYEHIIRNEQELYKIQEYIKLNPEMWEKDRNNPNHI